MTLAAPTPQIVGNAPNTRVRRARETAATASVSGFPARSRSHVGDGMFRKIVIAAGVACALTAGIPAETFAQQTTARQDANKAGREAKQAGKEAGRATKDAAKATAKGTKHVAKKTAAGAKKVAKKTEAAVTPNTTSATCKDGTVQVGKTKTAACSNHGGIKE
jgi:hypothetical protein